MAYQLSERGLKHLKINEGLRLTAYPDPASPDGRPWTIGYGHTGPDVHDGLTITSERAQELLDADVREAANELDRLVDVILSQHEVDALVSMLFNVPSGQIATSTLLRLLNSGDRIGAAAEFARWHYAGGKRNKGLLLRRLREAQIFLNAPGAY